MQTTLEEHMLQGQDEAGIASAAGIAAGMGAGLLEANRTGGTVQRVHCGWAARCGVAAADLARHGLTGPPTVLEGRFGFLHAFPAVLRVTTRTGRPS